MRIDKEEKRSLKRLFVGVLVAALLITMLPVGNDGYIVTKAADITVPTDTDTTLIVEAEATEDMTAETVVQEQLQVYMSNPTKYTSGMVINLGTDLDLSYVNMETGQLPENLYFVLNGYSLYGCTYLTELGYPLSKLYVNITGTGKIYANAALEPAATTEEINDWRLRDEMNVIISSSVVSSSVRFILEENSSLQLLGENRTIDNPINSGNQYVCYSELQGLITKPIASSFLNIEEIAPAMITDGTIYVENMVGKSEYMWGNKYAFTENALSDIPEGTTITYDIGFGSVAYPMLTVPFIVDNTYGIYSLEETSDGVSMTIYHLANSYSYYYRQFDENSTESEIPVRLMMEQNFTYSEVEYGSEKSFECDRVVFTDTAIPATYTQGAEADGEGQTYRVDYVIIENFSGSETDFYFDMTNHPDFTIWNHTNVAVDMTNENNNELWVKWSDNLSQVENIDPIEIETKTDGYSSQYYTKAGVKHTITPNADYTVYGIKLGDWLDGETGTEYYRLAGLENVTYHVDGTVDIVVPNFGSSLEISVDQITELEDLSSLTIDKTPIITDDETAMDWYDSAFTVGMDDYQICDITVNKSGVWLDNSTENVEGEHQKTYYVIDKTMESDGVTPSSNYGKISKFNYSYVLDTATPTITSVTATDANGKTMTLDGGWTEQVDTVNAETTWTNAASVTLKATANAGSGLPVAGYKFGDSGWQTSDSYTYTGDGIYEVIIHARDEFDTKLESANKTRPEAGAWVTKIGIDTIAPKIMFTDAKNATSSELKSNAQYEGNLHMVCDDGNGSGFAEINLYKKTGDQWVTRNDLLIASEEGSFIAPTTQNEVYKIEIIDIAGNEALYDNVTVVGYEQDVEVTVGDVTGVYGEDLEIEVTVKNTSDNTLEISALGLREDATDDAFATEVESVTELAAGESFTTKILLPKGANAGDYEAMLDVTYINMDEDASQRITKAYSKQIVATLEKATGTGSVTVENITYGQTVNATVASDTNGTENVTLYYKQADADDTTYTTEMPTNAGSYKAKAVFAATTNYKEVVAETTFTIEKAAGTGTVTVEDFYYGQSATVTVTSNTNGTDNVTVYYKQADADDTTYTTDAPRLTGSYKVKAVFAATANYNEVVVEDIFTITRISETRGMYSISQPNEDGVYEGPVVITALDGNLLSVSEAGVYREQITLNESIGFFRFYIKTPDGAITEAVILRNIVVVEPPVKVTAGRVHLDSGEAYEFGAGTWKVSGDSTNYAGGNVFYVPESGDYEFTQQGGGQ